MFISKLKDWLKQPKNIAGLIISFLVCIILISSAFALNRPIEGETPTSASQVIFDKAKVTAILEDTAVADRDNAEGLRVGSQEVEIQILSGTHKDEIMTLTNNMSALFNVDLDEGDEIIVRILTDDDGAYYASLFNYNRGTILGGFVLVFFINSEA